jgi:hypothetical protein
VTVQAIHAPEDVFDAYSRQSGTPQWLLLDPLIRPRDLVEARGILVWLLVVLSRLSVVEVAAHLNWPYSTASRRFRETRRRIKRDATFRGRVGEIEQAVRRLLDD